MRRYPVFSWISVNSQYCTLQGGTELPLQFFGGRVHLMMYVQLRRCSSGYRLRALRRLWWVLIIANRLQYLTCRCKSSIWWAITDAGRRQSPRESVNF